MSWQPVEDSACTIDRHPSDHPWSSAAQNALTIICIASLLVYFKWICIPAPTNMGAVIQEYTMAPGPDDCLYCKTLSNLMA